MLFVALPARADLESLYEPSVEWLVDSCDGIAIAKSEPTAEGNEFFTDYGRSRTMRKYRVTEIVKDHERIKLRKVFSGQYTSGKMGDRALIFLRCRGTGMVADHAINLDTPRTIEIWDGTPGEPHSHPLMAFDKDGAFIHTEKELLHRVKERMKGPDRVPEDCDYFGVEDNEHGRRSFEGGFYVRPAVPRFEIGGYDIDLHVLVPPEPEYKERFLLEVRQNHHERYMHKIVQTLRENYGVEDPRSLRYDLPRENELARLLAERNVADFTWKVTRDYSKDISRHGTYYQLSPDGRFMVEYSNFDGVVESISDANGNDRVVRRLSDNSELLRGTRSTMLSLHFSPKGEYIFWGSSEQRISIYAIAQEEVTLSFPGLLRSGAYFSPDEKRFATLVEDDQNRSSRWLSIWDVDKGEQLLLEPLDLEYGSLLGFSPGGRYLLLESSNELFLIEFADNSLKTKHQLLGERRHRSVYRNRKGIEVSPDDKRVAVVTVEAIRPDPNEPVKSQAEINVREITSGKELRRIKLPVGMIPCDLRFLGGGEYLIAEFDKPVDDRHPHFALLYSVDNDKINGDAISWEYHR